MALDWHDDNGNWSDFLLRLAAVVLILWLTACTQAPIPPATLPPTATPRPAAATAPPIASPSPTSPAPSPTPFPASMPTPWLSMPLFGVEPHRPDKEQVMAALLDSGAQLVRYGGVSWDVLEPIEGQINWNALQRTERVLQQLAEQGIEVILTVRGAPLWVQKVYGHTCGPIAPEKLSSFAAFMAQLVQRYSQPPYNVRYWELGNEPDVDPSLVRADSVFGCWGDESDPYYGGGYYAEMLKVVYPAIKAVDPQAQVLNGGLLMNCDPTNPPQEGACHATRFFEGILRNGGGDFLDIVNFHGYPPYVQNSLMMDELFPGWQARGGVVVGKISYLRDTLAQYGLEKPLFLTETSLLCPEWNKQDCQPPAEDFFQAQAAYLVRNFARTWALGLQGVVWYDFEGSGWRYASLVGPNLSAPRPAYRAFQYFHSKLSHARLVSALQNLPGIAGYDFVHPDGTRTWLLWAQDETPQTTRLPLGVTAAYDLLGNPIPLTSGPELEITTPTYIDFAP